MNLHDFPSCRKVSYISELIQLYNFHHFYFRGASRNELHAGEGYMKMVGESFEGGIICLVFSSRFFNEDHKMGFV